MGHIFGLFHTFQESEKCTGDGDFVADTPMEAQPNFDTCNENRDTCPKAPGNDPVKVSSKTLHTYVVSVVETLTWASGKRILWIIG
jgi:hypothetical protein